MIAPGMWLADVAGIDRRQVAIACVLAAMALVVLDVAMVNVALPTLADTFHVKAAASVQVVTAFQIGVVATLLPAGALGEYLGYRRVFRGGVALFVVGSGFCVMAPSLDWLVAFRVLQGIGGACVMALGVALLRCTVATDRLGAAIGWNAMAVALATAAGPSVGALVLSVSSWHGLFALSLPLGTGILFASAALPDIPGSGRHPQILPLDLLRLKPFRMSVFASICCFAGTSIAMVALPFHLKLAFGLDPLTVGLVITPWPLAVALAAPLAGRLADRHPNGLLCGIGSACLVLGLAGIAVWPAGGTGIALVPFIALCGFGFGLFLTPNNRNMFLSAPPQRSGAAGGLQGTARLLGQTSGTAALSSLMTLLPIDAAPRPGFLLGAGLALAAGLISLSQATGR